MSTSAEPSAIDDEIRLSYLISGGIIGHSSTYETDSSKLTEHETAELRELISAANFFDTPSEKSDVVVMDGYTRRLTISIGRRQHTVVRGDGIEAEDTPEFLALVAWVEKRTPPLFPPLAETL